MNTIELAVGERGSVISTAAPDASGHIRNMAADPTEAYDFEAANGRFDAHFSYKPRDDASVRLTTDRGASLSFGLVGTANAPRSVRRNVIQFTPDPNVRVKYTVLDDRVKESIVLLAPPKSNVLTFNFATKGLRMAKSPDGYHFFSPTGEEVFWLLSPTVQSLGSVKGGATLSISQSKMRLTIDKRFLRNAFYPVIVDPTVVGTSSDAAATAYSNNRKMVASGDGSLLLLYQRGADIVYKSSTDSGSTWTTETVASTSNSTQFGVSVDASDDAHLVYVDDSDADKIKYRKLAYSGLGTWTPGVEQSVEAAGTERAYPDVTRADDGRLWIAYRLLESPNYSLKVRYSDDGSTWSETTQLAGPSSWSNMYPAFVYYKGEPSLVYLNPVSSSASEIAWRYWTGTAWSAQETVPGVTVTQPTYPSFSAVSTFDNAIHVVYANPNGIYAVGRDDGTGDWSAPRTVSAHAGDSYPTVTTSGGGVRVFWSYFVGTNQYRVVHRNFNGSTWDKSSTVVTPGAERVFDRTYTELSITPWDDSLTNQDALFRLTLDSGHWGNQVGQGSNSGYALDTSDKKASVDFSPSADATLSAFRLNVTSEGTPPAYMLGLQTDATGFPSGNWIGGSVVVTGLTDGWTAFDIPDTQLTSGTAYHIVMQPDAVVDEDNFASFSFMTPNLTAGQAIASYDGTSWASMGGTPAYTLDFSDSTFAGQPVTTGGYYSVDSPGERFGERFTPEATLTPTAVDMRIARVGFPSGNLAIKIVSGADTAVWEGTIATPTSPTTFEWLSVPISATQLGAGQAYRLFVTSTGVSAANHYRVQVGTADAGSPYPELTWGGTTDTATYAHSGKDWTDKTLAAADPGGPDVPIFATNGDSIYLGMKDKFDYVYFDLGVAASASIEPTWSYSTSSGWQQFTPSENGGYDFTTDDFVGFTPPGDWAKTNLGGEPTSAAKYYVKITRMASSVATPPVAGQVTAVRNNAFPTTPARHSGVVPYAWTEGLGGTYRVKFGSLPDPAPEISQAEARHISPGHVRESHEPTVTYETTVTWSTNVPATSQIVYDTASHGADSYDAYAYSTSLDESPTQSHTVSVSSLTSDTVFYYRILSMNATGELAVSDEHIIPPGDLSVDTDICASCHRSHTSWRTDTWTDSTETTHSGLLIREP